MPTSSKLTNEMDVEIGQRIRALRIAAGISQSELGAASGVTFQQAQKQESGRNRISASALVLICKRLGVTPMEFSGSISTTKRRPKCPHSHSR